MLLFWVNGYGTVISDQRGPYRRERLSGKRYRRCRGEVWTRKYAGRSVDGGRSERPEHLYQTLKKTTSIPQVSPVSHSLRLVHDPQYTRTNLLHAQMQSPIPEERIMGLSPSFFTSKGHVDPMCVFKHDFCKKNNNTNFTISQFYDSLVDTVHDFDTEPTTLVQSLLHTHM